MSDDADDSDSGPDPGHDASTVAALALADAFDDRPALRTGGAGPADRTPGAASDEGAGDTGEAGGGPGATTPREYDHRRLRVDARRTGNALSHRGVRAGRRLAVAPARTPETVLAVLAGGLLGATVAVAGPDDSRVADARAVVAPTDRLDGYELPAGGVRVGYGAAPADPGTVHFEAEMWSENATFPPPRVDPEDPFLVDPGGVRSHAAVLTAAREVASELDLRAGDRVAAAVAPDRPGAVVAGVVAPLLVGAELVLPGPEGTVPGDPDATVDGDVAAVATDRP